MMMMTMTDDVDDGNGKVRYIGIRFRIPLIKSC